MPGSSSRARNSNGSRSTTTTPTTRMRMSCCAASWKMAGIWSFRALLGARHARPGLGSGYRTAGRAHGRTGPGSAAQGGGSRAVYVTGPDDRAALGASWGTQWRASRIDLSPAKPIGFGADDRQLVLARLQFLEGIGLAQKDKGTYWSVDETFSQSLRELGGATTSSNSFTASLETKSGACSA